MYRAYARFNRALLSKTSGVSGIACNAFFGNGTVLIPSINIVRATRTKISSVSGMTTSTVTFQSDVTLLEWEARAGGNGHGQGLLVGNGNSLDPITDQSFDIDYSELTNGDLDYRVTIYGKNINGVWSGY